MAFAFLVIVLLIGIDIQQKGVDAITRKTEGGLTMAKYIDREAAVKELNRLYDLLSGFSPEFYKGFQFAKKQLEQFPTADVAPVVHGRWINGGKTCSVCKQGCKVTTNPHKPVPVFLGNMPYCPKCGAKMDGGKNDAS